MCRTEEVDTPFRMSLIVHIVKGLPLPVVVATVRLSWCRVIPSVQDAKLLQMPGMDPHKPPFIS